MNIIKRTYLNYGKSKYAILLILVSVFQIESSKPESDDDKKRSNIEQRMEWFAKQRINYSDTLNEINIEKIYSKALDQKNILIKRENEKSLSKLPYTGKWNSIGPYTIGGRVTDVEMPEGSDSIIYVGTAAGGVFKTYNLGKTWEPIFDNSCGRLSIGDIAIDKKDTSIIYVGTGEVNGGMGALTYPGNGIFRSTDGGKNWEKFGKGLDSSKYISKIVIDTINSIIYAGVMGSLFSEDTLKGIYKCSGKDDQWIKVFPDTNLSANAIITNPELTGCIDLEIHPDSSNILYAAMWQRIRSKYSRLYGGVNSGIYKTTTSGESWFKIKNIPVNDSSLGRISIAISKSNPNILYSIILKPDGKLNGVFKTEDSGINWNYVKKSSVLIDNYKVVIAWNLGIEIDIEHSNIIYILGENLYKYNSNDSLMVNYSSNVHVDQHSLFINEKLMILGNDGGIYISKRGKNDWDTINNLAITQFYTCTYDQKDERIIFGGTQDNGTLKRDIDSNWSQKLGADGFNIQVDPIENNYVYAEKQTGDIYRSNNSFDNDYKGIITFSDLDRTNWNTPYLINPNNNKELFAGTCKIYKTCNRGSTWVAISEDLTNLNGTDSLGTITTISVSKDTNKIIYVGTDNGLVHVKKSNNDFELKINGLPPEKYWISRISVSPFNHEHAILSFTGFRIDDHSTLIYKTTNAGNMWHSLNTDTLNIPVNDVIYDNIDPNLIYIATDIGVFYYDLKKNKISIMNKGMPNVPVLDLDLHKNKRLLLAATHGRSMYQISLTKKEGQK